MHSSNCLVSIRSEVAASLCLCTKTGLALVVEIKRGHIKAALEMASRTAFFLLPLKA